MQLKDITIPLEQLTDDELIERLRGVRRRRTVERPVAKAKAERVEKKATRVRMTATEKLLAALDPEERARLIESLGGTNGNEGQA